MVGILNSQGTEVVSYQYDSWGKLLEVNGDQTLGNLNPFRYRGYYYEAETGLYYVSSRYYDPEVGRWINTDSAISGVGGKIIGYNTFVYCFNNPVNMLDPTGNWPKWLKEIGSRLAHTAKFMWRTVTSPFKAVKGSVGAGIGFGINKKVSFMGTPVEVGAVTSISDSLSYDKGKFDVKNTTSTNIGVNLGKLVNVSHTNGREHSYFNDNCNCDFMKSSFGQKSECAVNQPIISNDAVIGISGSFYFIFGVQYDIGIDMEVLEDELISIFYDSLSYGK